MMEEKDSKLIFSENLKRLMDKNEKRQSDLVNDLSIKQSTLSDWLNAKKFPRIDTVEKLATYFGVKKSALIEKYIPNQKQTYYLDPEVAELADQLHKNPELRILFDASKKLTKEDIQFVRDMVDRMKREEGH